MQVVARAPAGALTWPAGPREAKRLRRGPSGSGRPLAGGESRRGGGCAEGIIRAYTGGQARWFQGYTKRFQLPMGAPESADWSPGTRRGSEVVRRAKEDHSCGAVSPAEEGVVPGMLSKHTQGDKRGGSRVTRSADSYPRRLPGVQVEARAPAGAPMWSVGPREAARGGSSRRGGGCAGDITQAYTEGQT